MDTTSFDQKSISEDRPVSRSYFVVNENAARSDGGSGHGLAGGVRECGGDS